MKDLPRQFHRSGTGQLQGDPGDFLQRAVQTGRNGPTDFTDVAQARSADAAVRPCKYGIPAICTYRQQQPAGSEDQGFRLKKWLETAAKQFATIDPASTAEQD